MLAILGRILFFYVSTSLLRYFFLNDYILSKSPIVIVMAIVMGVIPTLYAWVRPYIKVNRRIKQYRYYVRPLETMVTTYLFLTFFRYAVIQDVLLTVRLEVILLALFAGIAEAVLAKIDDVSPRDPKTEEGKTLSYYYDTYVVHASPFHKLMFTVYG